MASRAEYERQIQEGDPRQGLLSEVGEKVGRGEKLFVINDFDLTVSAPGETGGDNPFDVDIDPTCADALRKLSENGHYVGILSNRAGAQTASRLRNHGINRAEIIGTYGFERHTVTPNGDTSEIKFGWEKYSDIITPAIQHIRNLVYSDPGVVPASEPGHNPEVTLQTEGGPLYLERKGITTDGTFPEGLSLGLNFNQITDLRFREQFVERIEGYYERVMEQVESVTSDNEFWRRANLWGKTQNTNPPGEPGRYSIGFEPMTKRGKRFGVIELKRKLRENEQMQNVGIITYGGDDAQVDNEAMFQAKRIPVMSKTEPSVYGIWVKQDPTHLVKPDAADIVVTGVEGNARMLTQLAHATS
jgi:hypothetical protein